MPGLIAVSEFVEETREDYNSPTTSTFVSRMPQCRQTITSLEEVSKDRRCYPRLAMSRDQSNFAPTGVSIFYIPVRAGRALESNRDRQLIDKHLSRETRGHTDTRIARPRGIASGNRVRCNRCVGVVETRDWNRYFRWRFHRSFPRESNTRSRCLRVIELSHCALLRVPDRAVPPFRSARAMPRFYSRARIARCVGVCIASYDVASGDILGRSYRRASRSIRDTRDFRQRLTVRR